MSCAPVLMYHQIVANEPGDVHAVKIESFADQMRWPYDRGFHSASVLMLRPECPRPAIDDLAGLAFVERRENVISLGPSGTGKTHLAIALGIRSDSYRLRRAR